jgi:hypothetical protein
MTTTGPAHVWVITEGEPDCCAVLRAFSTEQEALRYAEQLPGRLPEEIRVAKIQLQGTPTTGRYGSRTAEIEHFVDLVQGMTPRQARDIANAWAATQSAELDTEWRSARDAVHDAGRDAEWKAAIDALWAAANARLNRASTAWAAIYEAALALMAWDLVDPQRLESLIGPAASVFDSLRPTEQENRA